MAEHGDYTFESAGSGPGGGRVRLSPVSTRPSARANRSDALDESIIDDIKAFIIARCPTSPCAKHEVRRLLQAKVYETARAVFRHQTWDELWMQVRNKNMNIDPNTYR